MLLCSDIEEVQLFYQAQPLFDCRLVEGGTKLSVQYKPLNILYVLADRYVPKSRQGFVFHDLSRFYALASWADRQQCLSRKMSECSHGDKKRCYQFSFQDIMGYHIDIFYYVNVLEF